MGRFARLGRGRFAGGMAASVAALSLASCSADDPPPIESAPPPSFAPAPVPTVNAGDLSGILVVTPNSPGYNSARMDFNARIDDFPALIAYCRSMSDVQRVIAYANARNLQLSVRDGVGHDFEGYSLNSGGVVIDVSLMNGIRQDGSGLLQVLPGTQLQSLYAWSAQHGLVLPGGTCPTVCVAGLCSGGGFGFLSPWYGLFCDRLRRVQLVDAQTNLRDSASDSDLLWACQGGGGGNFGVIVASYFEPVPLPADAVTFTVSWPWDSSSIHSALQMYFEWVTGSGPPYYLSFAATARSAGAFSLKGLGFGEPFAVQADVQTHVDGTGGTLSLQSATFADVVNLFGGEGLHKRTKAKTSLGYALPPSSAIDAIVQHLENAPGPADSIELDPFGAAISTTASSATAFPHRGMKYILLYQAHWEQPSDDAAHEAWIDSLYAGVDPYFPRASYRNFSDADLSDWQYRYYGENYPRLQQIKARLDPANRFHYAQSIVA